MRGLNSSVETINAAATAIITAESRVQPDMVQKRRWGSCLSIYWCFGSHKHGKRIGHAVLVPEQTMPATIAPAAQNSTHPPTIELRFVAPPSSPASFFQSEPPSVTQSPAGLLSLTSLSANVYSPSGPTSIFAIGPYAHETQLVSPPVFSTFTTEPSTAPFTPPPESVQLTTPSSPEVPFARLLSSSLDPNHRNREASQRFPLSHYEFQSYQLYPGSPVNHLISPSSAISGSGTSSPFPDREFTSGGRPFLEFHTGNPPKLLSIDGLSTRRWGPRQSSGSLTPDAPGGPASRDSFLLESQISEVALLANSDKGSQGDNNVIDHRVSFELPAEEVAICVEKEPAALVEAVSESLQDTTATVAATVERDGISREADNGYECRGGDTSKDTFEEASKDGEEEECRQKHRSLTLGSVKEFNFDNPDGGASDKPTVGSVWWANEKVVGKEAESRHNWAFFSIMQPGGRLSADRSASIFRPAALPSIFCRLSACSADHERRRVEVKAPEGRLLSKCLLALTDDEILDRFDRILKSLSHYSEQWSFRSRCSRLPRSARGLGINYRFHCSMEVGTRPAGLRL
ncbi:hypothetical protein HHK36_001166 [Tetracentron sinense]|uniref:Uncharacterized protein n=1 Tax=Tetracentron sinense TaxID=13715 RepID=A0A834ZWT6_TETSI|nr:hypothetical protein HHK36_032936 [Tetracentron sinense]KAF8413190.1 hypothetical protein HHK36_001166 [Tetracentron sinense]